MLRENSLSAYAAAYAFVTSGAVLQASAGFVRQALGIRILADVVWGSAPGISRLQPLCSPKLGMPDLKILFHLSPPFSSLLYITLQTYSYPSSPSRKQTTFFLNTRLSVFFTRRTVSMVVAGFSAASSARSD